MPLGENKSLGQRRKAMVCYPVGRGLCTGSRVLAAGLLPTLLCLLMMCVSLMAQRVQCQLGRQPVWEGQATLLDISITGVDKEVEVAEWPEVAGLTITKMEEGFESSVMIINGRRVQPPYRVRARVVAEDAGVYGIPSPKFRVDGRIISGNATTLQVRASGEQDLALMALDASKTKLFLGERFTLTCDVYLASLAPKVANPDPLQFHGGGIFSRRLPPEVSLPWFPVPPLGARSFDANQWARKLVRERGLRFSGVNQATFSGVTEDVERPTKDGATKPYRRYRFEVELFADAIGTFRFLPATIEGVLVEILGMAGGEPRGRELEVFARSPGLSIEVVPLPTEGRTSAFSGAVGSFEIHMDPPTPDRVRVGDSIYLTVVVSGEGRLEGIPLDFQGALGEGFQVEEPKILDSLPPGQERPDGFPVRDGHWRQYEVRVRPIRADVKAIAPISLEVFDPSVGRYVTKTTKEWPITVTAVGDASLSESVLDATGGGLRGRKGVTELVASAMAANEDDLNRLSNQRITPWGFLGAVLGLLPLYFLIAHFVKRHRALHGDPALLRRHGAHKRARQHYRKALHLPPSESSSAVSFGSLALRSLIADLEDRVESGVTSGDVALWLEAQGVAAEVRQAALHLVEAAERSRYGVESLDAAEVRENLYRIASLFGISSSRKAGLSVLIAGWFLLTGHTLPGQLEETFQKAQADFAAGRYEESALALASLRTSKYENGYVLYNEGNAWLRAGQIGRAIAAYRRAERYLTGDANLERNLGQALAKREQVLPEAAGTNWVDRMFFLGSLWSPRTLLVATAGLAGLAFALALLQLMRNRSSGRAFVVALVLLVLYLGATAAVSHITAAREHHGVVVVESAPLLQWPDEAADRAVFEPLADGTEFVVLARKSDWLKVRAGDRYEGWLKAAAAETW